MLSLLIHGDAAFAGQGVVAETLNLSMLPGYRTGGTVHLVINNQVGFTTSPESARSSVYATDVAKMVQAPIFHVNGDDPEACVRVAKLAFAFRQAFEKDVVIDMVCYRRFGHNEGDEPSYTQPQMYERIEQKRSVRKLYTEALVKRGDLTMDEAESALEDFSARLQAALEETRESSRPMPTSLPAPPPTIVEASPLTGVARDVLDKVAAAVHEFPDNFTVHPKLQKQLEARAKVYAEGQVDWALGEAVGVRLAARRGNRRARRWPGHPSRHVQPSPRRARRLPHRHRIRAAVGARPRTGPLLHLRLAAVGVRGDGLRVRLLDRAQGRARRLGSAVRRLHERRADHHRPVPRRRRGQVGPDVGPRADAAARLRRPGTRTQLGAP